MKPCCTKSRHLISAYLLGLNKKPWQKVDKNDIRSLKFCRETGGFSNRFMAKESMLINRALFR